MLSAGPARTVKPPAVDLGVIAVTRSTAITPRSSMGAITAARRQTGNNAAVIEPAMASGTCMGPK